MKSIHSMSLGYISGQIFLSQGTLLTRVLVYAQIVQGLPCQSLRMIHHPLKNIFSHSQFMRMFKIIEAKGPKTLSLQNSRLKTTTDRCFPCMLETTSTLAFHLSGI